jgi:hypothetical protein
MVRFPEHIENPLSARRHAGWKRFLIAASVLALPAAADNPSITAVFGPEDAVVGVTEVAITGMAGAGHEVVDTSTFPDGTAHEFTVKADASGAYTDGPFELQQLGTFHDVLRDQTTGASTAITYAGRGDFAIAAEPVRQTVGAGAETSFTVVFKSVGGFGGRVTPLPLDMPDVPGAVVSWSESPVRVPADGSASVRFTVLTLLDTPARDYVIVLEGTNGSVTHRTEPIVLTVAGPGPNAITAAIHPSNPVVGVTQVEITGAASNGEWVTDTSTFPDGSVHKFSVKATGTGAYVDGPFVLKQLGTYHDVLRDDATGGTTTLDYAGGGDFSVAIDAPSQTVTAGHEVEVLVTFKSLLGFGGTIVPAVASLSELSGATAVWSVPAIAMRRGLEASSRLSIKITAETPAGSWKINVQGTNGSVTRTAETGISLTVRPP